MKDEFDGIMEPETTFRDRRNMLVCMLAVAFFFGAAVFLLIAKLAGVL